MQASECKKCIFNKFDCDKVNCRHYYIKQSIVDRHGDIYAIELLSRPIHLKLNETIEEYFNKLSHYDGKSLLLHQLDCFFKSLKSLNLGVKKIFLNIDRYLLLDDLVLSNLKKSSSYFNKHGYYITYEITERQSVNFLDIKKPFYRMIVDDISFAADDYSSINNTHPFINDYDYVKIDMGEIKVNLNKNFNDFKDELYLLKFSKVNLVAEKIETREDYLLAKSLPFDYFQGYYFNK